jgi:hypothetical protein
LLAANYYVGGCSNGTRGIFTGGIEAATSDTIQYVTIDTTGNATDFGDLTVARNSNSAVSDGTKGLAGGGSTGTRVNTIDYVNIASLGNASDFGDLTRAPTATQACSGD